MTFLPSEYLQLQVCTTAQTEARTEIKETKTNSGILPKHMPTFL